MSLRRQPSRILLAIGFVRLVAGRAERGGRGARDRLELGLVDLRQVEQALGARLHQPAHAVPHAEDAPDLARGGKAQAQAFDHARERLIDDGGRPAGLADHRITGKKLGH